MKLTRIVHIHRPIRTALAVLAVAAVPAGAVAVPAAAGGDRHPGKVSLVSVAATGGGGNGRSGHGGSSGVSAHGRYVLFSSAATDLVDGDTNGQVDVFVRDTVTSRTTLVSVGANGAQGNGESRPGSISADGRYVVFDSRASNLFPGDTNNYSDVFLRDLRTGRTTLVSVGLNGPADLGGFYPDISADGRHVAFVSHATNLVPGDTNDTQDIFVRNLDTRRTELVSLTSEGLPSDQPSSEPSTPETDGWWPSPHRRRRGDPRSRPRQVHHSLDLRRCAGRPAHCPHRGRLRRCSPPTAGTWSSATQECWGSASTRSRTSGSATCGPTGWN